MSTDAPSQRRYSTIPCSARESSPALSVPPAQVVSSLEILDELPADATGALVFLDQANTLGTVLLEGGRVCWAASAAMRRRLTDILRHQSDPPLAPRIIETVYQECRTNGKPLGEALVEAGVVTDQGLRSALRQHNAEAIATLGSLSTERRWEPRSHRRYDARYTFSSAELLVSIGALHDEELAHRSRRRLRQVIGEEQCTGVAYIREGGASPVPIGAVGADPVGAGNVRDLGNWAASLLDLSEAFSPGLRLASATYTNGMACVAWLEGPLLFAVLSEDRTHAARILMRASR